MVSIFSFFTKKRPKVSSTTDPSESRGATSPPASPRAARKPARAKSHRAKPTVPPHVRVGLTEAARRASSDGYGASKRIKTASGVTANAPPRINIALPFEARTSDQFDASLGLDAVGQTPVLTSAERRDLDAQRYTPADLRSAWEWLGPELTERGAENVGIMLPRRLLANKDRQRQLSALFVLSCRPELADKFPSLSGQYPAVASDAAAGEWKSRLVAVAKDTSNPVDLAEVLKSMLRRLASTARPIIDPAVYVHFVQQEHAASYPRGSYGSMLIPKLDTEVAGLLEAVLEACNAIAMHAEQNAMSAGRLCHLLGWWLLGEVPNGTTAWNDLYDSYKLAGQRAEHLFYARIRWQTTQQKMPRRLVQLILTYPFGESSASSEHLPLPPTSTFTRKALHIALGTDSSLPSGTDPAKLLGDALMAKLDTDVVAAEWQSIRRADGSNVVTLQNILSDDSLAFLDEVSQARGLAITASPPSTPTRLTSEEGRYHSFTADGDSSGRRRSHSYSTAANKADADSSSQAGLEAPQLLRQRSSVQLSPARPAAWADFEKSGFGDMTDTVRDISLSLSQPKTPQKTGAITLAVPQKKIVKAQTPSTTYLLSSENIIELDDAFIQFVEDGQLDPVASGSWPRFALVQLAKPLQSADGEQQVDWLLVTIKKREHRRPPSIDEPLPNLLKRSTDVGGRAPSISAESSTSRFSNFGLRDFANTFRRSSISGSRSSSRHSLIGGTAPGRLASKPDALRTVDERPRHQSKDSSASDAPTEYTVGEMGEIVKIPTSAEEAAQEASSTGADAGVLQTAAGDWVYLAEGGAHVVFRYRGADSKFKGRALRFPKQPKVGSLDSALRFKWTDELVNTLVPSTLLTVPEEAAVGEAWTRAVASPAELWRPAARRGDSAPLADIIDYSRPGQLMDDLTCGVTGEKVIAFEIKPKWGFIPAAQNLFPAESVSIKSRNCRFCLHQHYRGREHEGVWYCPLDLYSGDDVRVRKALDGLWTAWRESGGEANNLRVFVDGNRIQPKDAHLIPSSGEDGLTNGTFDFIAPLLESSSVLKQLKTLQSTLDAGDISTLMKEFKDAHAGATLFDPEHVPEPTAAELEDFVQLYTADPNGFDTWTPRQRQIAYGLSAVFKDCSIIIRAVLHSTGDKFTLDREKSAVKLIDTDLKPLSSLPQWAELDEKLWRHWAATKGSESTERKGSESTERKAPPRPLKSASRSTSIANLKAPETPPRSPHRPKFNPETPPASTDKEAVVASGAAAVIGVAGMSMLATAHDNSVTSSPASSIPEVEAATTSLAKVVVPSQVSLVDESGSPLPLKQAEPTAIPEVPTSPAGADVSAVVVSPSEDATVIPPASEEAMSPAAAAEDTFTEATKDGVSVPAVVPTPADAPLQQVPIDLPSEATAPADVPMQDTTADLEPEAVVSQAPNDVEAAAPPMAENLHQTDVTAAALIEDVVPQVPQETAVPVISEPAQTSNHDTDHKDVAPSIEVGDQAATAEIVAAPDGAAGAAAPAADNKLDDGVKAPAVESPTTSTSESTIPADAGAETAPATASIVAVASAPTEKTPGAVSPTASPRSLEVPKSSDVRSSVAALTRKLSSTKLSKSSPEPKPTDNSPSKLKKSKFAAFTSSFSGNRKTSGKQDSQSFGYRKASTKMESPAKSEETKSTATKEDSSPPKSKLKFLSKKDVTAAGAGAAVTAALSSASKPEEPLKHADTAPAMVVIPADSPSTVDNGDKGAEGSPNVNQNESVVSDPTGENPPLNQEPEALATVESPAQKEPLADASDVDPKSSSIPTAAVDLAPPAADNDLDASPATAVSTSTEPITKVTDEDAAADEGDETLIESSFIGDDTMVENGHALDAGDSAVNERPYASESVLPEPDTTTAFATDAEITAERRESTAAEDAPLSKIDEPLIALPESTLHPSVASMTLPETHSAITEPEEIALDSATAVEEVPPEAMENEPVTTDDPVTTSEESSVIAEKNDPFSDRLKRSTAPSPASFAMMGETTSKESPVEAQDNLRTPVPDIDELPEPEAVRMPPHNVELYQNAKLPPIPIGTSDTENPRVRTLSDNVDMASLSSADIDPASYATAPDTPALNTPVIPGSPVFASTPVANAPVSIDTPQSQRTVGAAAELHASPFVGDVEYTPPVQSSISSKADPLDSSLQPSASVFMPREIQVGSEPPSVMRVLKRVVDEQLVDKDGASNQE